MGGSSPTVQAPPVDPAQQELEKQQAALLSQQNTIIQSQFKQQQQLMPLFFQQAGVIPQMDAQGNITGFSQDPNSVQASTQSLMKNLVDTQNAALVQANQNAPLTNDILTKQDTLTSQLLDQQSKALNGTLPVNPAVTQQMKLTGQNLDAQLRASLGPDYATSTPGIQANKSWQEAQSAITFGANTGQLSLDSQLALANQSGYNQGTFGNVALGAQGGLGYGQSANANLSSIFSPNSTTLSQLGSLAGQTGQAMQPYQFQSGLEFQASQMNAQLAAQQNAAMMNMIGGIAGAGLGAAGGYYFGAGAKR